MNWLIYHIASGHAFFSGVALIIVAVMASTRETAIARRIAVLGGVVGVIAVAISSTAIPVWCYGMVGIATCAWLASRYIASWRRWTPWAAVVAWAVVVAWAAVAAWTLAAGVELFYHVLPSLEPAALSSPKPP